MTHTMPAPTPDRTRSDDWWRHAVVYQIYPRSFADSDGDGLGDIDGIRSRLDYLVELGVDAIWLSPFYPSPLADGGYDVSDHRAVDPRLGTTDGIRALIEGAHARGLKIIVDIVPNHTSDQHEWFQRALAAPAGSPERDRYVFRDGTGPDGAEPPSDWRSHFGGSAWARLPDGQWYLHLFAPEQPDLNWGNPEVRADLIRTLRFWGDLGVDGFRVDVAHGLAKDLSEPLRSQPNLDRALPLDGTDPLYDRDELDDIYREWRELFDSYSPPLMAVAESWAPPARVWRYARSTSLGQAFNFELSTAAWDAGQFRAVIENGLESARRTAATTTWVLSNHDIVRHTTRYALPAGIDLDAWLLGGGADPAPDRALGTARARAAALLMLALPGSVYVYQGDELALPEVSDLAPEQLHDPIWLRTDGAQKGRDGARVPLPWDATGEHLGFSTATPWLPLPEAFRDLAVATQDADPESTLNLYRAAIRCRALLDPSGDIAWLDAPEGALHFAHPNGWRCFTNFGDAAVSVEIGERILGSAPGMDAGVVPPNATLWYR
ncbi:glycoside hydrolase family 13 protein [Galbitalea sp. SE-J8]|uniref:glycoside hydrolase family 13 protein n=1 Tax=Galbitalea sp. SE-J8 TaxID=3054952 RepID=UPI00259C8355|nr:glycoside hydrolase family 13 protein [Galbitalea sp. SE-J8]MDM4762060.1 glycoside hydrolase family 13 protein [Galbitalea sp. SE-J8]